MSTPRWSEVEHVATLATIRMNASRTVTISHVRMGSHNLVEFSESYAGKEFKFRLTTGAVPPVIEALKTFEAKT